MGKLGRRSCMWTAVAEKGTQMLHSPFCHCGSRRGPAVVVLSNPASALEGKLVIVTAKVYCPGCLTLSHLLNLLPRR